MHGKGGKKGLKNWASSNSSAAIYRETKRLRIKHLMLKFCTMRILSSLLLVFLPVFLSAQTGDLLGDWLGEWTNPDGHKFSCVLHIAETDSGQLQAEFVWRIDKSPRSWEQSKLGLTGKEFAKGSYEKETRKVLLNGYRKEDPNYIIGIDKYKLQLNKAGTFLEGKTWNHGTWEGKFKAWRPHKQV